MEVSSDSENEFFDAVEITPERSHLSAVQEIEIEQCQKVANLPNTIAEKGTNRSNLFPKNVVESNFTSKLTNYVANFDPQDTNVGSAQKLLKKLDSSFMKEAVINDMPPPTELSKLSSNTLQVDQLANEEETTSACSGSMLSYLGFEETQHKPVKERRRAKNREKKRDILPDQDEVSPIHQLSSCMASGSSSTDTIYPMPSAPFRVVEHDAASVYSTNLASQEKVMKLATNLQEVSFKSEAVLVEQFVHDQRRVQFTNRVLDSEEGVLLPEPDIVASTKANSLPRGEPPVAIDSKREHSPVIALKDDSPTNDFKGDLVTRDLATPIFLPPPVVPPRRNKIVGISRKMEEPATIYSYDCGGGKIRRGIGKKDYDVVSETLDINAATSGDYVVNPQDTISSKGIGPSDEHISSTTEAMCMAEKHHPHITSTPDVKEKDAPLVGPDVKDSKLAKQLSDQEILDNVCILNLDTGESIPLSEAETQLPSSLNPLSLHIMKLTNEFAGDEDDGDSDEDSIAHDGSHKLTHFDSIVVKQKAHKIKKYFGRKMESAVNKAKNIAQEVSHKGKEEKDIFEDDTPAQNTRQFVKIKTSHSHKGPLEFDNLMYAQELKGEHMGPVWCIKHSPCGRLLATAGQDHVLRVWVLKQAFNFFLDIRTKWNADVKSSPTPSQESLVSQVSSHSSEDLGTLDPNDDGLAPYMPKPFCIYAGHTADVLDMSWSKHYFILTSSMDKTARLWHISRKECLCIFKHVDFVTAIAFHPKDDRYFISGSLDGKLRLWSIPDKQVVLWNEVTGHPKLITAANFCQNGAYTVVGTYNGRCIFYKTAELKYYTQIHVKSSRGRHARKITGIEPLPDEDKLLITSNDSRIRLYDLNVLNVSCKYKGHSNYSSQIRAGFSHDGKYLVSGSENQCIYIWKTHHDYSKFTSARKDRNIYWEGVKAHSAVVTCAVFSPHPEHVFSFIEQQENMKACESNDRQKDTSTGTKGYVLVSADFNGVIKVFLKKEKPKHSSLPASALV